MKIGFDARLITYRRGIGNYVFNLLRELAEIAGEHEFYLYVDSDEARPVLPRSHSWHVRHLGRTPYPVWEQTALPLAALRDRLDVLHCPANTAPILMPSHTRLVVTVHDVMYMLPQARLSAAPSLYNRIGSAYRRWVVPRVVSRAVSIVTDSRHSQRDIEDYVVVEPGKVAVVYHAPNRACSPEAAAKAAAAVQTRYGLDRAYFLALAATDPRKNTARILQAFARCTSLCSESYQLALVGLPARSQGSFQTLASHLGIAGDVVLTEFVPEDDLAALYSGAKALLYPSLYEGFGLPILEAMYYDTPVITSARASLPEVSGDAALVVDPENVEAIADAMHRVVTDAALCQDLIGRGRIQVATFSWRSTATQMLRIYEQAALAPRLDARRGVRPPTMRHAADER